MTIGDVKAVLGSGSPIAIAIDWILAPDHATRVALIDRALDIACNNLVASRHLKQDHSEDALTVELVAALKYMNMDATHDTDVGGHSDIVVRAKDEFLWVAEAKIHSSYVKLLGGFDQLATRYSTGMPGQQDGGMIIYCFGRDAVSVMNAWLDHLGVNRPDVTVESGSGLCRNSHHKHPGAGSTFRVRHRILPLYWAAAPRNMS